MEAGQFFLDDKAGKKDADDAIGADHRGGEDGIQGHGVDVEDLAKFLAAGGDGFGSLFFGEGVIEFPGADTDPDPGDQTRKKEGQAIKDEDIDLAEAEAGFAVEENAIGSGADGIKDAIEDREKKGERALFIFPVVFVRFEEDRVEAAFHDGQGDDAGHDEGGAGDVQRREGRKDILVATEEEEEDHTEGGKRAGGVLDGADDGELQIAQAGVADDHGDDIGNGRRGITPGGGEDGGHAGAAREGLAEGDQDQGTDAHHQTDPDGDLQVRLRIRVIGAFFVEEIGEAPAQEADGSEEEPGHDISFLSTGLCQRDRATVHMKIVCCRIYSFSKNSQKYGKVTTAFS